MKITQGLGEDEEQDSGDEEDEEEEGNKGKTLIVVMPLSMKAQRTKKKSTFIPSLPNKPRTKEPTIFE